MTARTAPSPRIATAAARPSAEGRLAAWYLRDVLRSCKTGEVVEATPQPLAWKVRVAAAGLLLGVPAALGMQWFFKTWVPRYYAELDVLAKVDPVASAREFAEFTPLLLLAPVLACIVVVIAATVQGARIVRAGRRPLPGAKVRRRTEVVAGWWCVRLPALLGCSLLLGCAFWAWSSYVELASMVWNGYLDKQVEVSSNTPSREAPVITPPAPGPIENGVEP